MSDDTTIESMSVENGSLDIQLKGHACQLMAASFADQFKDNKGTNYVELSMFHEDTGELVITMQRKNGITPGAKASKLEEMLEIAWSAVCDAGYEGYDNELRKFMEDKS